MSQYARNNPDLPPFFEAFPNMRSRRVSNPLPPKVETSRQAEIAAAYKARVEHEKATFGYTLGSDQDPAHGSW